MTDTRTNPNLFSRDPAERRAFRDALGAGIGRFVPPELRPLLGFVAGATPSAAVERAGAASMRAVQPGRTGMERLGDVGEVLSETAGVVAPAMVAGRAAMPAAEAAQEAFMGVSVPARAAAETVFERLNQPGPMPETLYSGFDPQAYIRGLQGRAAESDAQRLREDLAANDQLRAERGLPPLNPDPRPAAPTPDDFGYYQDNPALKMSSGAEWLENKQRVADETYAERRGITGSTTATLGSGKIDMFLPTDFMRRIPGLLDERRVPGEVQYERLMQDVRERGFLPDQDRNRIVLGINHRGEPFIIEGNTRTAVASDLGIPNVRVEVRYKNGGEMVDGPFAPQNIARIAARGPEGFARGGEVMMRSNMPEQLHRGIGSLNEVARGMYRGGAVQYMQDGGEAITLNAANMVTPQVNANELSLAMREAQSPAFRTLYEDDFFVNSPLGYAAYEDGTPFSGSRSQWAEPAAPMEQMLGSVRREVGAPDRTAGSGNSANIQELVQIFDFLQQKPVSQLTEQERALLEEIPQYLAMRTGM